MLINFKNISYYIYLQKMVKKINMPSKKNKTIKEKTVDALNDIQNIKYKFSGSLLYFKKNNLPHKIYYWLIDHPFFYKQKSRLKYVAVSLVGVIVNTIMLVVLTSILKINYLFSATLTEVTSIIYTFFLNKKYTFNLHTKNFKQNIGLFVSYFCVCLLALCIILLTMYIFVEKVGIFYLFAWVLAGVINFFTIYPLQTFLFKSKIFPWNK
jgi:putative flippase GtrA